MTGRDPVRLGDQVRDIARVTMRVTLADGSWYEFTADHPHRAEIAIPSFTAAWVPVQDDTLPILAAEREVTLRFVLDTRQNRMGFQHMPAQPQP